ncbi:MAG: hypothetical protein ACI81P_000789 [Neolewinella sp.]
MFRAVNEVFLILSGLYLISHLVNMLKLLLPLACSLLLLSTLEAQSEKQRLDEVVFADGTTAQGRIDRATLRDLGKAIAFKAMTKNEVTNYSPGTVNEFTFGRSGRTFRAVDIEVPDPRQGGKVVSQRRFGQVLIDGEIELIRIDLAGNEYNAKAVGSESYFYLLRQGEVLLPLELTTIYVYDVLHANPSRFRNKLKFFVRGCDLAFEQARRADFNDASIMRALSSFGECKEVENMQMAAGKLPPGVKMKHFGRIATLDLRDENYDDRQFSLSLGYQMEAGFTNRLNWLGLAFSADYVYHAFRWEESSNIAQSMLKGNVSLGVYPLKKDNFSVMVTAGLSSYNAFDSSFSSFFSNNYFLLSSGVRIQRNNFLLDVGYEYMPNQIMEQPGNILLVGVGYQIRL